MLSVFGSIIIWETKKLDAINYLINAFSLVTYAHQPANLGRSMTLGLYPL